GGERGVDRRLDRHVARRLAAAGGISRVRVARDALRRRGGGGQQRERGGQGDHYPQSESSRAHHLAFAPPTAGPLLGAVRVRSISSRLSGRAPSTVVTCTGSPSSVTMRSQR